MRPQISPTLDPIRYCETADNRIANPEPAPRLDTFDDACRALGVNQAKVRAAIDAQKPAPLSGAIYTATKQALWAWSHSFSHAEISAVADAYRAERLDAQAPNKIENRGRRRPLIPMAGRVVSATADGPWQSSSGAIPGPATNSTGTPHIGAKQLAKAAKRMKGE